MDDDASKLLLLGYGVGPAWPKRKHWGKYSELYTDPEFTAEVRMQGFQDGTWPTNWVMVQPQPDQDGFIQFVGFDLDLDEDPPSENFWPEFWVRFKKVFGPPEKYVQVRTPSGGLHLWVPLSDGEVTNREFCKSLQIRGKGGLLMCPPSNGLVEGKPSRWQWVAGQSPWEVNSPSFPASVFEKFFKPYASMRGQVDSSAGRHDALRRDLYRVFSRLAPTIPPGVVECPAKVLWMEQGRVVVHQHESRNGVTIYEWEGYSCDRYLDDEWERLLQKLGTRRDSNQLRIIDGRIVIDQGEGEMWPILWFSAGIQIEAVSMVNVYLLSDGLQPQAELFVFHTSHGPFYLPAIDVSTTTAFNRAAASIRLMYASILPKDANPMRVPLIPFLRDALYTLCEGTEQIQVPAGAYELSRHSSLRNTFGMDRGLVWVAPTNDQFERLAGYTPDTCRSMFGSDIVAGARAYDDIDPVGMADWMRQVLGFHRPQSVIRMAAAATFSVLRGAFRDLAPGFQCPVVWVVGPSGSAKDKGALAEIRELAGCVHGATPAVCRRAMFTARHGMVMHNEVGSIERSGWEELLLYSSDETPMTVYGQKPGTLSATMLLVGESIPTWCNGTAMEERRFVVPVDRVQDRRSFMDPTKLQLADFGHIAGGGLQYRRAFTEGAFEAFCVLLSRMKDGLGDYLNSAQVLLYEGYSARSGSIDTAMHLCARLFLWMALGQPADVDPLDVTWDPEVEVAPGHKFRFMSEFSAEPRRLHGEEIWDTALVQLLALLEHQRVKINVMDSSFVDPPEGFTRAYRAKWSFHLGTNPWVRPGAVAEEGRSLWGNRRPFSAESLGADVTAICRHYGMDAMHAKSKGNGRVAYRKLPDQFAADFQTWYTEGLSDIELTRGLL